MVKPKAQARSSRAAADSPGFGLGGSFGFATTSSPLSYLAELPDISVISDANIVVIFKNLFKKDGTTKARALEELAATLTVDSNGQLEVEDAIVDAWVGIYPRTSIDSSRRVRQLAHGIQGQICTAIGKRVIKHLPKTVGPWLLGLYDNDKIVSNAARAALALVFPTSEKQLALRKRYQEQVLVFCRTIIDKESTHTLSDERTVSPDEAAAKYSRVVAAALGLIASLVGELNAEDMQKSINEYEELIQDKKLWGLATSADPNVRRALHRFLRSCIQKESTVKMLDPSQISSVYIEKGLESDQKNSASEFLETLIVLTHFYPLIWTEYWKGKKPAHVRLRHFLKHGSQSAPQQYWSKVAALLGLLPSPALPVSTEEVEQLMGAFHKGITKKDEPRMYLLPGLTAYVQTIGPISKRLPDEDQKKVLRESVLPIVRAYIFPSTDLAWTLPSNGASDIVQKALELRGVIPVFKPEWVVLSERLVEGIKKSLPEQSKEYASSQNSVGDAGFRWATVLSFVLRSDNYEADYTIQATKALRSILEVCKSRNGKPYGAASVTAHLVSECRSLFIENSDALSVIESFILNDLPRIYLSPSLKPLASILGAFSDREVFKTAWTACLETTLKDSESSRQVVGFKELVSALDNSTFSSVLLDNGKVRDFLIARLDHALDGSDSWDFIAEVLAHSKQEALITEILASMTASLSILSRAQHGLIGFLKLSKTSPHMLQAYLGTAEGRELLSHILRFTETSDDEIAHSALELNERIHSIVAHEVIAEDSTRHGIVEVIHAGLTQASPDSVSVETLISQAQALMKTKTDLTLEPLLPRASTWKDELSKYLAIPPLYALAITSPLHAAVFAVDQADAVPQLPRASGRDLGGYSVPLRMAVYTTELLKSSPDLSGLDAELLSDLFRLLVQTMILANDNLGLIGCNGLWSPHHPLIEADMIEFVSQSQSLITSWLQGSADWWDDASASSSYVFVNRAIQSLFEDSKGRSATSYYAAHSYHFLIKELIDVHGWPVRRSPDVSGRLMDLRKSKDLFRTLAYVSSHVDAFSNVQIASRWYNELLADLTGLDISEKGEEALQKLLILNEMISGEEESFIATAAHQRLVFFTRHVTVWLQEELVKSTTKTATCTVVSKLLPSLLSLYGDHWETLISWINEFWLKLQSIDMNPYSGTLPLLHSTLRLYTTMKRMTLDDECNEDLIEAIKSFEKDTFIGLLNILSLERHCPDNVHQPLRIINELIARVFNQVAFQDLQEPESLYHLMSSKSEAIQMTAYKLLHKQIPLLQAQLSLEVIIDNKVAQLPDELLSIVLDIPKRNELEDMDLDQRIPLSLKGYLLSWMLVFDHFKEASYQLKSQYASNIKDGGYIVGLLDIMVDILGLSGGKSFDATKSEVTSLEPDTSTNPRQELEGLLTHLYYLSLVNTSSSAKNWWIESNRLTVKTMEAWTARYISPHIISAALFSVRDWSEQQAEVDTAEGAPLIIKVSPQTSELTASYPMDEERSISIIVYLPPAFPLHQATVSSRSERSAIDERRWQGWLRSAQGVIAFSNNNIVDGLLAWRRNVVGALQGKSECTICYSLVGEDGKLPTRKCKTCKNTFHTICLAKWFASSGNKHCPLCRSDFVGR